MKLGNNWRSVKNLSSKIIEKYPSVDWSGATTMSDRLIHGYFGVEITIVRETNTSDLPKLKNQVEQIWQDID